MQYEVKQGNSFWYDYNLKIKPSTYTITDIDAVWTNWNATWRLSDGITTLTGDLSRSAIPGRFYLRIDPVATSGWSNLPVGSYNMTVQTTNDTVHFFFEDDDDIITIMAQSIP
jgi:hypothetical protein